MFEGFKRRLAEKAADDTLRKTRAGIASLRELNGPMAHFAKSGLRNMHDGMVEEVGRPFNEWNRATRTGAMKTILNMITAIQKVPSRNVAEEATLLGSFGAQILFFYYDSFEFDGPKGSEIRRLIEDWAEFDPRGERRQTAVEVTERGQLVSAMASVGIQIDKSFDDSKFCVRSVVAIVRKLAESAAQTPIWLEDDYRFTAGIFAFSLMNAVFYRLGVPFEQSAQSAAYILISAGDSDEDGRDVDEIAEIYNDMTKNRIATQAIGQTFLNWIIAPTQENYDRLAGLYKILGQSVGREDRS